MGLPSAQVNVDKVDTNGRVIERLCNTSGPPIAVTIISNGDAIMLSKI